MKTPQYDLSPSQAYAWQCTFTCTPAHIRKHTHTTLTYVHMHTACFHIVCSTKESISTLLLDSLIQFRVDECIYTYRLVNHM